MPYLMTTPTLYRPIPRGLGQTASQEGSIAGAAAGSVASAVTGIPGLSALVSLAGGAIAGLIEGCGSTCTEASNVVNQAEPLLQQNLSAYLSIPAPRSQAAQQQAQENFNQVWQAMVNACSSPSLGSAGQNCIADREQGACHYKTSPGGWQQNSDGTWSYVYPGASGSGDTCWNWFVGYLDPITEDPTVGTGSELSAVSSQIGTSTGTAGSVVSAIPWWAWALGIGLVAWAALK